VNIVHDFANYEPSRERTLHSVFRNEWVAGRAPSRVALSRLDAVALCEELDMPAFRVLCGDPLALEMLGAYGAVRVVTDDALATGKFRVDAESA
jgi:hypothetical protein